MSSSRSNTLAVTDACDAHVVRHAGLAAVSQLLRFDISLNLLLVLSRARPHLRKSDIVASSDADRHTDRQALRRKDALGA